MRRLWCAASLSVLVLGGVLSSAFAASAADAPPDDTGNLSVVVTDGTSPTPSPSGSAGQKSGAGATGAPGSGPSVGSNSSGTATTGNSGRETAGESGAGDEVSVDGMLYLGGLTSSVSISPDPAGGVVTLWFTVRNASRSTIDATADFWMNSQLFGLRVDSADAVAVTGLLPGESRVVSAELHHAGQWSVLDAHVTLTPPESVDGVSLAPATRDATVLVFPWVIFLGVGAALALIFSLRAIRATSHPRPELAEAT